MIKLNDFRLRISSSSVLHLPSNAQFCFDPKTDDLIRIDPGRANLSDTMTLEGCARALWSDREDHGDDGTG